MSRLGKWIGRNSHAREFDVLSDVTSVPNPKNSVLLFNHHKCASTFVKKLLALISQDELRHHDYSRYIERAVPDYVKRFSNHEEVFEHYGPQLFSRIGGLYGPLRRPFWYRGMEEFKAVFFVRDPRDSIISYYYSMGYSHRPPASSGHVERFYRQRERIRATALADYALGEGRELFQETFRGFREICSSLKVEPLVLTYDSYRESPKDFVEALCKYTGVDVTEDAIDLTEREASTKPLGVDAHNRCGRSMQFMDEFPEDVREKLTREFENELRYFGLAEFSKTTRASNR